MTSAVNIQDKHAGKSLAVAGGNYRIVVSGDTVDNQYALIEMTVPPGGGPPPHSHAFIRETFYVLEGEVEFRTEAGSVLVKKDGFVQIPPGGAIHCFTNNSTEMARLLCTVMPAGLEKLFEEFGTPVAPGEFLPPPPMTPELVALLKKLDEKYRQVTYPRDYFDKARPSS